MMASFNERLKNFAVDLYKVDGVKFGEYKMKVGKNSPVYYDLRVIVSYPALLESLSQLIVDKMESIGSYKVVCGVPYTALPVATVIAVKTGIPMVLRRKEAKDYGTRKLIEGKFLPGDSCLIVEDVITSGSSILETVGDLSAAGLDARDAVVVLDREQGGATILKQNGINVFPLLTMSQLMQFLHEAQLISQETAQKVKDYVASTQLTQDSIQAKHDRLKMSYAERIPHATNPVTKRLLRLMSDKRTNLCVAADLTSSAKILKLADDVGPYICVLKLHADIVEDFSQGFVHRLRNLAEKHQFLVMEDRKFADIGQTVSLQFSRGVHKISTWADLVTAHSLPGPGVVKALNQADGIGRGIFLLAEISSAGNLINTSGYTAGTVKLVKEFAHSVAGVVSQSQLLIDSPGFIQLTPGIQSNCSGDNLGQQYNSPESAVLERGADIGVVGRGITLADNPIPAAESYRKILWESYLKRLKNS